MADPISPAAAERAATRYTVAGSGCWISTYSAGSHGYAQIGWGLPDGRSATTTAHRAAWTFHNGPIPDGLTVDHLCHARRCVRPDHLRLLSNRENGRRNHPDYGDWPLGYCRNGHPDETGSGECPICSRASKNRHQHRRRSKSPVP